VHQRQCPGGKTATHFLSRRVAWNWTKFCSQGKVPGGKTETHFLLSDVPCCSLLFSAGLCCSLLFSAALSCSLLLSAVLCCSLLLLPVLSCSLLFPAALCCSLLSRFGAFPEGSLEIYYRVCTNTLPYKPYSKYGQCIKGNVPGGKTATHFLSRSWKKFGVKSNVPGGKCL
jgi:hypothetical protein